MTSLLQIIGTDVFSTSTDGVVYLWDIRKLIEPVESWPLQQKDSDMPLGGISLDFESTMVSNLHRLLFGFLYSAFRVSCPEH